MKPYYTSFVLGNKTAETVRGINLSAVFEEFDQDSPSLLDLQVDEERTISGYRPEIVELTQAVKTAVEAAGAPFGVVGEEGVVWFTVV